MGSVPRTGRSLGKGSSNQLQYSCLENSMDRGDWRGMVHGGRKTVLHDLATKIYFYISDYLYGIDL